MVGSGAVHPDRIRLLSNAKLQKAGRGGGVVYWMQRDQRVRDNWALLYAAELCEKHELPLSVVYCNAPPGEHATPREYCFRIKGLAEVQVDLDKLNVPFRFLQGEVVDELVSFCSRHEVAAIVTDFSPLREPRAWKEGLVERAPELPVYEVDAHNIVPVWVASDKQEVGARTIRKKITEKLPKWLVGVPTLPPRPADAPTPPARLLEECKKERITDWNSLIQTLIDDPKVDSTVGEVEFWIPGAAAALQAVDSFCEKRLKVYADKRNDPNIEACSDLSPYLNFGHLSSQRMALRVKEFNKTNHEGVAAFLEESIVRRELSDNFCYYQPHYDSLDGAAGWARESLELHAKDKREHIYSLEELAQSKTHDDLWNAAQTQLVRRGKMHGFMRMYWAKKILEWSPAPDEALKNAIFLNDHYALDGRDPNGFVGCAWSVMGTHDMGWAERAVFGKIRYMNYNGCKRKFDVKSFVAKWPKSSGSSTKSARPATNTQTTLNRNLSADSEEKPKPPPPKKPKLGIPLP